MLSLFIAIAAFFLGVVIHPILHGKTRILSAIDAAIVLAVLGLVGFDLLPHIIEESGWSGAACLTVGFGLTFGLDKVERFHQGHPTRSWAIGALILALVCHAVFDGAALSLEDHHNGAAVIGVLLHRFPLGMVVHHLLGPKLKVPLLVFGLVSLSTVFGYVYTNQIFEQTGPEAQHLLEAFVVGMLIQVVVAHLGAIKSLVSRLP